MKKILFVLMLFLLAATACNTSGEEEIIKVTDPWGRTSPMVAENGAFYMMLTNDGDSDDTLLTVASDACNVAELHEMYNKGDGVMGMRPVEEGNIPVPAGDNVELKPGGLHVMCMGKQIDFAVDTEISITLTFENAGEMEITAVIRDN